MIFCLTVICHNNPPAHWVSRPVDKTCTRSFVVKIFDQVGILFEYLYSLYTRTGAPDHHWKLKYFTPSSTLHIDVRRETTGHNCIEKISRVIYKNKQMCIEYITKYVLRTCMFMVRACMSWIMIAYDGFVSLRFLNSRSEQQTLNLLGIRGYQIVRVTTGGRLNRQTAFKVVVQRGHIWSSGQLYVWKHVS